MMQSVRAETTRVDRRRRRNRDALLRAARRLMAERGFAKTTIADITQGADLGFGTFYLYFKSKEEILSAVLEEGFGSMLQRVQDPTADGLPPWDALRFVVEQFVGAARENADLFVILFRYGPDVQRSGRRFADAFTRRLQDVLDRGIDDGSMRPVPSALVARAMTGMYVHALLWRGENGRRRTDEIVSALFPIVRDGLNVEQKAKERTT
jgi:AcrR family transcriptional regulator